MKSAVGEGVSLGCSRGNRTRVGGDTLEAVTVRGISTVTTPFSQPTRGPALDVNIAILFIPANGKSMRGLPSREAKEDNGEPTASTLTGYLMTGTMRAYAHIHPSIHPSVEVVGMRAAANNSR
ncbi:hypothetical protein CIHG_03341 [Coccidioides immitis H538.4]|uniref:Uncharacterized protein n=1 Tax=Coccidioides immitis H538.4 TaxID=396776 RepID=A0A0J8UER4_COCIT|nr:hypothetical protein CIHG_03341 [Coccidioides immitis H538.4]